MKNEMHLTWVEINLNNLIYNIKAVKKIINKGTKIMAVVKADGYGHGAVQIGQTLLDNGIDYFAVSNLREALHLRRRYKNVPILILGYSTKPQAKNIITNNVTQSVSSYESTIILSKQAQKLGKKARIHIKIDTGMNRFGIKYDDNCLDEIERIYNLPNIFVEGIFTHFATADEKNKDFTYVQLKRFQNICKDLNKKNIEIPLKHVSNSAAIIDLPEANLELVRPGIILYGLYPSDKVNKNKIDLKEVMSLRTKVVRVNEVEAYQGVSYGLIFKTDKKSKIATLPIGYADGFSRLLTKKAKVIIHGKKVPVVGRICMDFCMIDVTGLDVKKEDEVLLFGNDGKDSILIDEIAKKMGTINYEIICMIGKRVPRLFIKDEKNVNSPAY